MLNLLLGAILGLAVSGLLVAIFIVPIIDSLRLENRKLQLEVNYCSDKQDKKGRNKGLYQKYRVEGVDGKPIPHGCIVLEWGDPNAREGIAAFCRAVRADGYEKLAADLDKRLEEMEESEE